MRWFSSAAIHFTKSLKTKMRYLHVERPRCFVFVSSNSTKSSKLCQPTRKAILLLSVSYRYLSSVTLALWPFEWSFRFQILLKVGCCTCPRCKDKLWWSTLGPVGFFEARRFGSPGLDGSGCPVGRSWESTHGKILRRRKLLSYESYLTNLYLWHTYSTSFCKITSAKI